MVQTVENVIEIEIGMDGDLVPEVVRSRDRPDEPKCRN